MESVLRASGSSAQDDARWERVVECRAVPRRPRMSFPSPIAAIGLRSFSSGPQPGVRKTELGRGALAEFLSTMKKLMIAPI